MKNDTSTVARPAEADDPNEKPYPGFAREAARLNQRIEVGKQAQSDPLPGPLAEAFAGDPPVIHGFTLQPVTMSLIPILKKIKSPLLETVRILREELQAEPAPNSPAGDDPDDPVKRREAAIARANERIAQIETEDETMSATIYCFVHPVQEVRALLKRGWEVFQETALREIGDKLSTTQVAELQRAVSFHYAQSFATAIRYEAKKSDEPGQVFTQPPAEPMRTGSVGG